ncbi:ABC transporter ATP-binding protein [Spiroplasma platyhelix]|uniref:ABC transporter ATP-binding protein n=1 Tax=Spiroplasma platyhelix PALS-1 TaxID=1276218 RepID=A0A846TPS3_9MOLU|nr:ABC transporter ATP-binding protein [Spiroplasma platyhelix]MBE4703907.1 Vitamin B12 import ATP-binding protein BtuD [Spiroplasma platyhelix PALS-1]NKE38280.1 ABC transporter ATP-binding protein [Spiroplasma platyhelix PALS-1]UJB29165.1 ABC transporter ATP-binding protein [Spiroplasma platyhelix PALS-1]
MGSIINDENVKITNVSKKYKNNLVIKDLSLTISNKARIGIVGPNGSGKTTLCEMIAQLRRPTSGAITLKPNLKIGMQLQEGKYPKGMTGWDLVNYYLRSYKLKKSIKEIKKLLYFLDAETIINKPISTLSGGQQQKINILLALIVDPDLLILDELATGLDLEVRERIYELLENEIFTNKDLSVLIVSHNMNEIERFCKELIFMLNGEIISIHNVKKVIQEYGSVEHFVKEKFKAYKVGIYNKLAVAKNLEEVTANDEKWAKSWKKHLDKKDKDNDK